MKPSALWNALRSRLGPPRQPRGTVVLQHLGLSDADLGKLRPVLDAVGTELGVNLNLHTHAGDLVLLDQPFSAQLSPQLVLACAEGRPVVMLDSEPQAANTEGRLGRWHLSLVRQLRQIDLVRARSVRTGDPVWAQAAPLRAVAGARRSPEGISTGFDTQFDTRIDGDQLLASEIEQGQQAVLREVLRAAARPGAQAFVASYGDDANVLFDFRARLVFIDPLAQQHLRVRRELPRPAPGQQPGAEALVRELDETIWDLGIAAGPHTLLGEPADWWRSPLRWVADGGIERYSRIPRHLDLTRRLLQGPSTPSELRRHARVSVIDLRRFIQAGLMGQLLQWAQQPDIQAQPTGAH